ncbi:MAG: hypothetical protein ACHQUC_01785 [Chlamydiales bacterium]
MMNQRSWVVLRTLINRYDPNKQEALLRFLPPNEQQAVLSQDVHSYHLEPLLYQHQDTLDRMHYSWLIPLLDQFSESVLPLFVSALSPQQAAGFQSRKLPHLHLAQSLKLFMRTQLYSQLEINNRLPLDFLPETDLTPLAYYDKKELMAMNDFLGLYDLASEVRRIVNKTHLKNIYTCLSSKQFYYLKACLHQKEKLVGPPLGFDPSKPDCTKLKQLIHRRGLMRLGKALCGQHKDLVWYITHTLDTGRGKILLNQYKPEPIPTVTSFLQLQVINVMNFLKSE